MDWGEFLWWLTVAVAGAAAGVVVVHTTWRLHGQWKIRRAGPRRLRATRHVIWREPAPEQSTDLRYGPGGQDLVPAPPYRFQTEHFAGSQPCVAARDARGRLWRVKWGHEAKPESFAVRLAWACGYFAEVTHYVAEGRIDGVPAELGRARNCLEADGRFQDARFELEDESVRMLFDEHSWAWNENPFVGTPQLSGLKMVVMLLSNWDTKDRRDVSRGSNTAIFEARYPADRPGVPWVSSRSREARYLITDWGGAMGKWGSNVVSRGRWDPEGFEAQTPQFVVGVKDGWVNFGYLGQRTAEIARDITVAHVEWFYRYASRIPEASLREGLLACGATEEEAVRFARALRDRIRQLGDVSSQAASGSIAVGPAA